MPNAEQITNEQVKQFHAAVEQAFSTVFSVGLKVGVSEEGFDWLAAIPGAAVYFQGKPSRENQDFEFYNSQLGGNRILFRLNEITALPLWVSWSEEWKKASVGSRRKHEPALNLVGVSVGFYTGVPRRDKTLLIRAEWDNPNQRGNEAAQPHWHIDPNLIDLPSWNSEFSVGNTPAAGALEELSVEEGASTIALGFHSLQRLHLGMAGWMHENDNPRCWQHRLELGTVADWVKAVLRYSKTELPRVRSIS